MVRLNALKTVFSRDNYNVAIWKEQRYRLRE
jgi:hypothetical protein